ncbi:hypothetical protein F4775DRAFT_416159 [Biscogniauxia sp. FL1348]|nr:hypothetical protein F4775DRAFT_416159 [Biscogniauxia sp. FL1348]
MSTTPRSSSPDKSPQTPAYAGAGQSMMVEHSTHLEESPGDEEMIPPQSESPPRTQILNFQPEQARHRRAQTPEPLKRRGNRAEVQSPGHLTPFDWDHFEDRYEKALQEADEQEKQLLEEFEQLVKYFNVWASASSSHDNERAIKRLQTRERYVRLSEQNLSQKKQHLSEVVRAFQSALALLNTT